MNDVQKPHVAQHRSLLAEQEEEDPVEEVQLPISPFQCG